MKKKMKRAAVFLVILALLIGKPARSEAAVPAFFAAVPVSWPVIAAILIGAGVGTAIYYNSLPEVERQDLLEAITDRLVGDGLTLKEKMAAEGALAVNVVGQYIRAAIVGDKTYVGKEITDSVLDVAQERGMTGGTQGKITSVSVNFLNVGDNIYYADRLIEPALWVDWVRWNVIAGSDQISSAQSIIRNITPGSFFYVSYGTGQFHILVSTLTSLSGDYVIKSISNIGNRNMAIVNGTVDSKGYDISYNGSYTVTELDSHTVYFGYADRNGSGVDGNGNVGNYVIDYNGVPSGELGQAVEQDGAWDLPGGTVPIDNYGDATPVSLGSDVIGAEGIASTWSPDIAYPDSIALPDVVAGTDDTIPVTATQEAVISGAVDVPEAIPATPELTGSFNQFLVPEWIKSRFPWCIPFDLADAFTGLIGSPRAPVFHYVFDLFGNEVVLHIDLAMFDDIMVLFRYGQLLMFGFFLMYVTKDLIKW